jgi:hypothetical protein
VFAATVANIGSAAGNATVEVFDHNDNLVGKVNLSLQPGESITVQIGITLPSASGTYTWTVSVRNALTGNTDDSEAFTVVATAARGLRRDAPGAVKGLVRALLPADLFAHRELDAVRRR